MCPLIQQPPAYRLKQGLLLPDKALQAAASCGDGGRAGLYLQPLPTSWSSACTAALGRLLPAVLCSRLRKHNHQCLVRTERTTSCRVSVSGSPECCWGAACLVGRRACCMQVRPRCSVGGYPLQTCGRLVPSRSLTAAWLPGNARCLALISPLHPVGPFICHPTRAAPGLIQSRPHNVTF